MFKMVVQLDIFVENVINFSGFDGYKVIKQGLIEIIYFCINV